MAGIEFSGVSKRFGKVQALDRLSFSMPAGQLTGFLGPNGAGKSTSFRALLGITRIDQGTITALGHQIGSDTAALVKRVGAIIEDPGHHKALTGRDNMRVAAATLGRGEDRIGALLTQVGMADHADRKVSGYSKGMRQRLGLAAALLGDPDLLILDEPLDGLDPAGQVAFKATLRNLVDEHGKTVVVSSHDLRDVEELADHVVVIDQGSLVTQGPTDALIDANPRIRVRISDPAAAAEILAGAGYEVGRDQDALVVSSTDGAAIVQVLAEHGLYPSAVVPEQTSLERVFLNLTGGGEQ
jgi:ABC-2 type transport system ATP-binding protein